MPCRLLRQETNGANLQADAAVYELSDKHSIPVDFHLSGAMTNSKIAAAATPATPILPEDLGHVHRHAVRELAGGHQHERTAA